MVYITPLVPFKSNEQSQGKYMPTKSLSNKGIKENAIDNPKLIALY